MELIALSAAVGVLLAYANGANDNFKGVATLFGSGITDFRRAIHWGTAATLAGAVCSVFLAGRLLETFTGNGLVPPGVVASPDFALATALAAGTTVLIATRIGMPISTTHALTGGLAGAGWAAAGSAMDPGVLGGAFFLPLLLSPVIALALAGIAYRVAHRARRGLGVERHTCLCVGSRVIESIPEPADSTRAAQWLQARAAAPGISVGEAPQCRERYVGQVLGIEVGRALDGLHYLSAGAVSFARGLNDTPKIAALLLAGQALSGGTATWLVALAMAAGGLLSARRVAHTMAHRITPMNPGQGLTANVITAVLVLRASEMGMPVSTTHVSSGALFGIGAATGGAHWRMIGAIAMAWLVTLPVAAGLGVAGYHLIGGFGLGAQG